MYIPKQFRQEDRQYLLDTIKSIKLGALLIFAENRLGVIDGLSKSNNRNACEVAKIMHKIEIERNKMNES